MIEDDISFRISADLGNALTSSMPNWKEVGEKFVTSSNFGINHDVNIAHVTTEHRLRAARLCLSILNDTYKLRPSQLKNFMIRAMFDNIFFILPSALDALSFEINEVYGFKVRERNTQINHYHPQTNCQKDQNNPHEQKGYHCVRCKLDEINDELSKFLNEELPKQPSEDHWYWRFGKYRNQVTHRTLYMSLQTVEGQFVPDDTSKTSAVTKSYYDAIQHKVIIQNYTQGIDPRDYCQYCFDKVLSIIEKSYEYLRSKIE